jgi:2-C-methyl-D-erythritol 4-phosphate cytidylyltransferase
LAINIFLFLSDVKGNCQAELKFALPGKERQDSVYNGLQECAVFFFVFTV